MRLRSVPAGYDRPGPDQRRVPGAPSPPGAPTGVPPPVRARPPGRFHSGTSDATPGGPGPAPLLQGAPGSPWQERTPEWVPPILDTSAPASGGPPVPGARRPPAPAASRNAEPADAGARPGSPSRGPRPVVRAGWIGGKRCTCPFDYQPNTTRNPETRVSGLDTLMPTGSCWLNKGASHGKRCRRR